MNPEFNYKKNSVSYSNNDSSNQRTKSTLDSKENQNVDSLDVNSNEIVAFPEPQKESSSFLFSNELSTINLNINASSMAVTSPQSIVSPNSSISSSSSPLKSPTISTPLVIPPIRAAHLPRRSLSIESLPQYSTSIKDKPPKYYRPWTMDMDPFQDIEPTKPKRSWSITKKIYFFGFLLWPIWIVGAIWICAKEKEKRRWCE
ncbi:hypothetical protein G9A89_011219 [Geosiphon pyriformis]|nr:hypothetical protein G9A89_011219 [Geosiphon pyriformis]